MGRCVKAVVLDLNGGVGLGRALPSGGAQSKVERGKAWEGGVVFQRGLGVLFIGPGRSTMVGVYGGGHGASTVINSAITRRRCRDSWWLGA